MHLLSSSVILRVVEDDVPPKPKPKNGSVEFLGLATSKNQDKVRKQRKKPISEQAVKEVVIGTSAIAKDVAESIGKRDAGITETQSVDHLYKEIQNKLITTMNAIGLDAESVARKLKHAMDLALKTGKTAMGGKDGRTLVEIPDLRAYKDLLFLWGNWTRIGRPNATNIGHAQFNLFGNAGLDEASKQRVIGVVELLEAEVKRRGLPDILPGDSEIKDAETLSGMVDASEGEEAAPGGGPS